MLVYWLLAALILPAAGVAGVLWLAGPLGYGGAIALTATADAVVLWVAARAAQPAGAGARAVGGMALTVLMTWVVLALAFVVPVSNCHGCLS